MRHATLILLAGSTALAGDNLLQNPGFEDGLNGWSTFGNAFSETAAPPQFVPFEGDGLGVMFGNFTGDFNVSGMFQAFDAAPGSMWALDVYSRHYSGDALFGDGPPDSNWAVQKIAFKNADGAEIGAVESIILSGASPTDVWIDNDPIMGTAPDGTTAVEAFLLFLQPFNDGGAAHFDNASFTLVPAPGAAAALVLAGACAARRRR